MTSRAEVVAALSHALDLTEGQPRGHAGRRILGILREDIGTAFCGACVEALHACVDRGVVPRTMGPRRNYCTV